MDSTVFFEDVAHTLAIKSTWLFKPFTLLVILLFYSLYLFYCVKNYTLFNIIIPVIIISCVYITVIFSSIYVMLR